MSLKGREVLEGQIVALKLDVPADDIPWIVYPDVAGMSKDCARHAAWTSDVKWAVNQRKSFLDQSNQAMDVTIVPAVRESVLHTGSDPITVGDLVYVRAPSDADVQAQQSAFRDFYSGRQVCPPMFATYGIKPRTVDQRGRMFECMDRYRRYLTSDETDFEVARDGGEGTISQIELSKVARIARLLSYMNDSLKRDDLGGDIMALGESIDSDAAGEESALRTCRKSNVFKTSAGVQFTSQLLAMLYENDTAMYEPCPIGEVLQTLEPTPSQRILTGHKMAVKLFKQ